jgi:hypothetical protein
MPNSRHYRGCGDLRLNEPKAAEQRSAAPVFSGEADARNDQDLSFLARMSEFDKIRKLTIGEAILMFATPETGLQ